jgi:hypothetical protein
MARNFENWTVDTQPGDVVEGGLPVAVDGPAVRIHDPRAGWDVRVTVDRDTTEVTSFELMLLGPVSSADLAQLPLKTIAEVAAAHADLYWAAREAGDGPRTAAHQRASVSDGLVGDLPRARGKRPPMGEYAEVWLSMKRSHNPTPSGRHLPKREALAEWFGVNVQTIDTWTRAARDKGLLPGATTGRLRKAETPPATRRGTTERNKPHE